MHIEEGGQLFTFHSLTIECKTSKVEMPSVQQNSIVASYASLSKGEAALLQHPIAVVVAI